MREILTILASLLIACLTVALVGPHFVDWRAQRPWVEQRLSDALGTPVRVAGDIDVTLLPTPRLELDDVHLSDSIPGAARVSGERAVFELAVGPLLRGALQFSNIEIRRPRLELTIGPDGAIALPETSADNRVQLERIALRDGTLVVSDPARGTRLEIAAIDLDAQADSLTGPFKGTGSWRTPENLTGTFKFATASTEGDRLRLKLAADPPLLPRLDLDGALVATAGPAGTTHFAYQGGATLSSRFIAGLKSLPWRATGTLEADTQGARYTITEARLGEDELGLAATGTASLAFDPAQPFTLALEAPQVDIDRLFADRDDSTPPARRAVAILRDLLASAPTAETRPTDLSFSSPAVAIGGQTATDLRLHLVRAGGLASTLDLALGAPGGTRIALEGTLTRGDAPGFAGHAELNARDMPRLRDWLAGIVPGAAAPLASFDLRRIEARGTVDISPTGLEARELDLVADRSHLTGRVAYTAPQSDRPDLPGRLVADLDAPALDLDGLPDLSNPAAATSDLDLDLKLRARAVRLARVGDGMIDAGHIGLDLARTGTSLTLKSLSIADIGGASVTASGALGSHGGSIHATLVADRLGELAALVGRVAPGRPADWLAARATALSPAKLTLDLEARRDKGGLLVTKVDLSGTARGTTIDGHAAPDPRLPDETSANLRLETADLPMLLRQIGFETLPLGGLGGGRLVAQVHAAPSRAGETQPWETNIEAELGGTRLDFDGLIDPAPSRARGSLRLQSADIGPLVQALALVLPDAAGGRLPTELTAGLDGTPAGVKLERIAGTLFGTSITGDVAIVPPAGGTAPARAQITGALGFDTLSLPALAGLALGPPQPGKPGARWSDAPFGPALANPPEVQLDLQSRRLQLLDGLTGDRANLRLAVSGGRVALEDMSVGYGSGHLAGHLQLRRDKAIASLSGRLELDNQTLDRPSLSGRLGGAIDLSSTGTSPSALVAGLAGSGSLQIEDLRVPRTAADALPRLLAASDDDGFSADDATVSTRLARDLDRAALALGSRQFDVGLASGALRLTSHEAPVALPGGVSARITGGLDLRSMGLEERIAFAVPPPKDWKDKAPPAIDVVWRGPLASPQRDIEVGSLAAGLSAKVIARETARIEAFESDVRERAFFMRRLKGLQFMRQRDAEIATYAADQARRAAEEEKQRQAAAALAAKEAARDAARDAAKAESDARAQREREQQDREINQMGSGALNIPTPRPALPVGPVPGGG